MFSFSFYPVPSFSIKKRQIFAFYNHWIFTFDINKLNNSFCYPQDIKAEKITLDNIEKCYLQNDFFVGRLEQYLKEQSHYVDGFLFYKDNTPVGFLWVMYQGGNEFQYRIRNTDSFLFDACVFPEYRGQGICGIMFHYVFSYLKYEKKCQTASWGVRKNNISAIKSYKKLGGCIVGSRKFIQVVRKYNFPYYKI